MARNIYVFVYYLEYIKLCLPFCYLKGFAELGVFESCNQNHHPLKLINVKHAQVHICGIFG